MAMRLAIGEYIKLMIKQYQCLCKLFKVLMEKSNPTKFISDETIDHCRWKTALKNIVKRINPNDYNKPFNEILLDMYNLCKPIKGLGKLVCYDLAADLARYHGIIVDKVYIIVNGPKRAIKILNITKIKKIKIGCIFHYVEIIDVINAFKEFKELEIDKTNGDILESYLCNWQKGR
jgi:hypothetical protein